MNNDFKYISFEKSTKPKDIIKLINLALKEKDIKYQFTPINNITVDGKKPPISYKIQKTK
jgi:hypothetical protein|tara:strand:+ start:488 stop:667 length:180 start_codon:yes stop_codon:yes gene_type:complete